MLLASDEYMKTMLLCLVIESLPLVFSSSAHCKHLLNCNIVDEFRNFIAQKHLHVK